MTASKFLSPQPQFFGEIHNQALDYVYDNLKPFRGQVVNISLALKVQSTISVILHDFFKLTFPLLVEPVNDSAQKSMQLFYSLDGDIDAFTENLFAKIFFSPEARKYIDEFRTALTADISPEDFQSESERIYNGAYSSNDIQHRESEQLLTILQIAIYSSKYWADNINQEKWAELINDDKLRGKVNWKLVGHADAAGAAGGVVRFGVIGLFGGPVGWGAFAGSVLGGAAAASVSSIVKSWLKD